MVFMAWEYDYAEDLFRFFNQAIKSLRLLDAEKQERVIEALTVYLNNTIVRKNLEEVMEEGCRETAALVRDTMESSSLKSSVALSPLLLKKGKGAQGARKKRSRLALWRVCSNKERYTSMSISKHELMLIAFRSHFRLKMALGVGAAHSRVKFDSPNSPVLRLLIKSSIERSSPFA